MCDAISMLTAVGVAGNVASGVSSYRAGRYNAKLAEREADAARETAKINADRHRRQVRLTIGRQRAQFGASGVTMEGTPALVLTDTASEGELDARIIERGGTIQADALEAQAESDRYSGDVGAVTGVLGAGRTVLSGVRAGQRGASAGSPDDEAAIARLFS